MTPKMHTCYMVLPFKCPNFFEEAILLFIIAWLSCSFNVQKLFTLCFLGLLMAATENNVQDNEDHTNVSIQIATRPRHSADACMHVIIAIHNDITRAVIKLQVSLW